MYGTFYTKPSFTKDTARNKKREEYEKLEKEELIENILDLEEEFNALQKIADQSSQANSRYVGELKEEIKMHKENIKVLLAEIQRLKYGTNEEEYELSNF